MKQCLCNTDPQIFELFPFNSSYKNSIRGDQRHPVPSPVCICHSSLSYQIASIWNPRPKTLWWYNNNDYAFSTCILSFILANNDNRSCKDIFLSDTKNTIVLLLNVVNIQLFFYINFQVFVLNLCTNSAKCLPLTHAIALLLNPDPTKLQNTSL